MNDQDKQEDVGCAVFLLLGMLIFLGWVSLKVSSDINKDRCQFERNVAVAIHNGHIITHDCIRTARDQ